ncbi:MAG: HSP20 family protein [Halioglobus sp.]|jgi:HSP20 family protein
MNTNRIASNPAFGKIFDELFNRGISDIVGTDFTSESPSVNIIETDESFELEVAAPGLTKEDFDISIEKDHLTISADRKSYKGVNTSTYKRKEYDFKKFSRKFRLPNTVDKETVTAKYNRGILKVTVDKTPEAKEKGPRTINID